MWNSKPKFAIRYFIIGNHNDLYYTEKYVQLTQIIKSGNTLGDIFRRAEQELTKIKVADMKPAERKKYDSPELLPFLSQEYFEITLSLFTANNLDNSTIQATKNDEATKLLFFSFKDYHLDSLRKFTEGYDKAIKSKSLDDNELIWSPGKELSENGQLGRKLLKQINEKNEKFQEKLGTIQEQGQKVMKIVAMINDTGESSECKQEPIQPANGPTGDEGMGSEGGTKDQGSEKGGNENSEGLAGTMAEGEEGKNQEKIKEAGESGIQEDVKEKIADGKGKEYFANDLTYVGEYRGGLRHGVGYFVTPTLGMCYVESINGKVSGI